MKKYLVTRNTKIVKDFDNLSDAKTFLKTMAANNFSNEILEIKDTKTNKFHDLNDEYWEAAKWIIT